MKTAVVVGALGVIGRYIVERLSALPDWSVIGLSRRKGEDRARVRYVSVDLLQNFEPDFDEATHVFYAAFQAGAGKAAGYAENIAPNRDMLINSVSAIDRTSPGLERVVLVTGTKYYGTHLGPFRTPARETDPRHRGRIITSTRSTGSPRFSGASAGPGANCGRRRCADSRPGPR
ncbi:MAG: NAD-dependent epimerase/dehydratase family protein [Burkholderiales bacterium]|nr:NAD-dependent epimerase/dehydratase family protein [Burkholderiales bacterium]